MSTNELSRRHFLAAGGLAAAGLATRLNSAVAAAAPAMPIRCGFVGVGHRGSSLLRSVVKVSGVEVAAICDIDKSHRQRASDAVLEANGKRPDLFDDWTKFLARDDIPVVVSALPCYLHYPLYRDALAARKHLYGEKPMCLTVAHADDLVKRAREAGTVFQIGYQRRFSEKYRASVKALRSGVIGTPYDGRGVRMGRGGPFRKPGEWFSFREKSGDWMLEQAVHHWDGLNWALDELPVSAYGSGRQDVFKNWDPKRDVSDYYTAIIKYKSGLTLSWTHTWASPPDSRFGGMHEHLVGPGGGLDIAEGFVSFRKGASQKGKSTLELSKEGDGDLTLLAVTDFFDCVRTGREPFVGAEDGRNATLFGLMVRESVYKEGTVTMDEILGKRA